MKNENCGYCKYSLVIHSSDGEPIGICRRYPPLNVISSSDGVSSIFSTISKGDWCGEFKKNDK